jgi:hypothetical protein
MLRDHKTSPSTLWQGCALASLMLAGATSAPGADPAAPKPSPAFIPPAPQSDEPAQDRKDAYFEKAVPPITQSDVGENWTVAIQPAPPPAGNPTRNYEQIYRSIPFRRAEYLANPSYRHDSTMELMFGQLRPTVVNRTDTPQRVVNPRPGLTQPYPISKGELYSYWPLLQYGSALPLLSPIP